MGIHDKPRCLRVAAARGAEQSQIDRVAGVLSGYSVITRGEALGHGMWVDGTFLSQVVEAGNASAKGLKKS